MAHHGRPGGRALELLLLALLICLTIAIFLAPLLLDIRSKGLIVVAIAIAAPFWIGFLTYYKYDTNTLRPLDEDKEEK